MHFYRLVIMLLDVIIMRGGLYGAAPTHDSAIIIHLVDYGDFGYHCSETMPKAFEIGTGTLPATVPATVPANDCFD